VVDLTVWWKLQALLAAFKSVKMFKPICWVLTATVVVVVAAAGGGVEEVGGASAEEVDAGSVEVDESFPNKLSKKLIGLSLSGSKSNSRLSFSLSFNFFTDPYEAFNSHTDSPSSLATTALPISPRCCLRKRSNFILGYQLKEGINKMRTSSKRIIVQHAGPACTSITIEMMLKEE
jgi:hypothetical protein